MNNKIEFSFFSKKCIVEIQPLLCQSFCILLTYGNTSVYVFIASENLRKEDQVDGVKNLRTNYHDKHNTFGKIPRNRSRRELFITDGDILVSRFIDRSIRTQLPYMKCKLEVNVLLADYSYNDDIFIVAILAANIATRIYIGSKYKLNIPVKIISCEDGLIYNSKFIKNEFIYSLMFSVNTNGIDMVELTSSLPQYKDHLINDMKPIYEITKEKLIEIENNIENVIKNINYKSTIDHLIIDENKYNKYFDISYDFIEKNIEDLKNNTSKQLVYLIKFKLIENVFINTNIEPNEYLLASYIITKYIVSKLYSKNKKRFDNRNFDDLRDIVYDINPFKQSHSSILFSRGKTQILASATIGKEEEEIVEDYGKNRKIYAHYNFYSFVCNEIGRNVSNIKRRELGHGYIVENSINSIIDKKQIIKNSLRLVTDVMSSDGSSSIASSMASSILLKLLGLNNSGILVGIGVGGIKGEEDEIELILDISGSEDEISFFDAKIILDNNKNVSYIQIDSKKTVIDFELFIKIIDKVYNNVDKYISQILQPLNNLSIDMHKNISRVKIINIDSFKRDKAMFSTNIIYGIQKNLKVLIEIKKHKIIISGEKENVEEAYIQVNSLINQETKNIFKINKQKDNKNNYKQK